MILDFLFPNRCLHCDLIIPAQEIVCPTCLTRIEFTHYLFHEKNLLLQKCQLLFPTEYAWGLMYFKKESLNQKIIHHLKYGRREKIGKVLALWTAERIQPHILNFPTLLTTIPLHPKKQRKRGYNQLHLFANTLSELWKIPVQHELLKRNSHGKAQAQKNKNERQTQRDLFSLQKELSNEHILIIDDVFTTGNTMSQAAWEILSQPQTKVSVLVMAID